MKIVAAERGFCKAQELVEHAIEFLRVEAEGLRVDQVERELFTRLMGVGCELLEAFIKQAGDGDVGRESPSPGEGPALKRSPAKKRRPYRSIFGLIQIERYVYAARPKQKAEYLPLDQQLGLPAGEHSYVLEDWLQRLCVQRAFAASATSLADLLGCSVSTRTAERMNRELSRHVEPFRGRQRLDEEEEEILVVTADGKGVPMRRPLEDRVASASIPAWRRQHRKQQAAAEQEKSCKRLGKGQKRGQKQMAYVGAVYSIVAWRRTPDDVIDELRRRRKAKQRPRPRNKQVWAEMTRHDEGEAGAAQPRLFAGLALEVQRRDPIDERPLVCLMDGQRSLWCLKREWLSRAVPILDIFHVMERLWKAAYCFHKEGSPEAEEAVTRNLRMLLEGKVGYLIGVFRRQLATLNASRKKDLSKIIKFFQNNRDYMHYDVYLASGYPIGSGVVEGACRHLVKDRMECTGMRWELEGAQAMLDTRSMHLSGQWDDFFEYRVQTEQNAVYSEAA